MKTKIIMMSLFLVLGITACNSEKKTSANEETPKVILDAFAAKFPNGTNPKWEKENETEFEANFEMDGKKYSTKFDMTGKWLETESSIESNTLPQAVKDTLAKNFEGFIPEDIELAETFDKGNVYEMTIEKGEEAFEIVFSSKGDVLKKENEKEDEKGEEDDDEKEEKEENKKK